MNTPAIAVARTLGVLHRNGIVPDYEHFLARAYGTVVAPGSTVLDIGAHAGRHTAEFEKLVGPSGRVVAFEPIPGMARALRQRFAVSRVVEVREKALAGAAGQSEFLHVVNSPEESGLRERIYNQPGTKIERIKVGVSTVDSEAAGLSVGFIKIDIEGGEIDCLVGSRQTLARCRPVISVEYGFPSYSKYGHTKDTLFNAAQAAGYAMGDLFGNPITSLEEWRDVCDVSYWDYFMIPLERLDAWSERLSRAA